MVYEDGRRAKAKWDLFQVTRASKIGPTLEISNLKKTQNFVVDIFGQSKLIW